jgi:hypothetical protein
MNVEEVEEVLADMLDTYAGYREVYICGDPVDFHSLKSGDRDIAIEVVTYRNAARLLREHRDENSGMGLPSWLWDVWAEKEAEVTARLDEIGGTA